MKVFWIFLLACGSLLAQGPLTFAVCNADCASSAALPPVYQFPDTAQGQESSIELMPSNTSASPVEIIGVTTSDTQDFLVTNVDIDGQIAPEQSGIPSKGVPLFVHFIPRTTGPLQADLTVIYCVLDGSGNCSTNTAPTMTVGALNGNGTFPHLTLSCKGSPTTCGGTLLYPETTVNFGNNVPDGTSASATFWVLNQSSSPLATQDLISLSTAKFNPTPFVLDTSSLPAEIAPNASASFTVTFSPQKPVLSQATLVMNSSSFPLQGNGSASTLADASSLVVSCTDAAELAPCSEEGATFSFDPLVAGTSAALNFAVSNPQTTIGAVNIPAITVSGPGFALTSLPAMPSSIEPGGTLQFQVTFASSAAGTNTGTLTIGTLKFTLNAQAVAPLLLPSMSLQVNQQPLTSDQQADLTIQLASPAQASAVGTLTMDFKPSVANVTGDPAVEFLATNGRQLNVTVAPGAQTATYNGQSALAFQTGTTAGTLTFTLQFPDAAPLTKSFTIPPEEVHIASATATLSSPNIVITINGYDDTYSVGRLSFTFYDTKGNAIAPGAIAVDASSQFQQYFFKNNKAGGAFSLQATFPVYGGDAGSVGSVSVTLNNSVGPVTATQNLQ